MSRDGLVLLIPNRYIVGRLAMMAAVRCGGSQRCRWNARRGVELAGGGNGGGVLAAYGAGDGVREQGSRPVGDDAGVGQRGWLGLGPAQSARETFFLNSFFSEN